MPSRVVEAPLPEPVNVVAVENPTAPADKGLNNQAAGFNLARTEGAVSGPQPVVVREVAKPQAAVAAAVVKPTAKPSFADAFEGLAPSRSSSSVASGAVDLRKIVPARDAPKLPPPPVHPSRIWLQIGVGRDTDRLAYDWRKMLRDEGELMKSRKAFVTEWGRTNRLLIGPFDGEKAADTLVAKLKKAGHDGAFVWTSPTGQVVDPLDGK
jgi:cell division septation protein DedD